MHAQEQVYRSVNAAEAIVKLQNKTNYEKKEYLKKDLREIEEFNKEKEERKFHLGMNRWAEQFKELLNKHEEPEEAAREENEGRRKPTPSQDDVSCG